LCAMQRCLCYNIVTRGSPGCVPGAPSRDAAEENRTCVVSGSWAAAAARATVDASLGANTALQCRHHIVSGSIHLALWVQPFSAVLKVRPACGSRLTPSAVWEAMTASARMPPEFTTPCTGGWPRRVRIASATCAVQRGGSPVTHHQRPLFEATCRLPRCRQDCTSKASCACSTHLGPVASVAAGQSERPTKVSADGVCQEALRCSRPPACAPARCQLGATLIARHR